MATRVSLRPWARVPRALGTVIASLVAAAIAQGAAAQASPPHGPVAPAIHAPATASLPLVPTRRIEFDTTEGTWLSLDRSPDGERIVFDMLGDLYVVASSGGTARALSSGLGFDTQPTFSPDGTHLAFVSDRSGADNLWVANADGSEPRQISFRDDSDTFISPAWSADGTTLYVSRHRADLNMYELWQYASSGLGEGVVVRPARTSAESPEDSWQSTLGVVPSPDGRYLYYAAHTGKLDFQHLPEWDIRRLDLRTKVEDTVVSVPHSPRPDLSVGSAFRPALSPDGTQLVYGVHQDGQTGLRIHDLATHADRWLAFPVEHDQLMALAAQDLLPRYAFTPDGHALILARGGHLVRLELGTGVITTIPFTAHPALDIGPFLRRPVLQETGPVRARQIQAPTSSPDGRQLAFSAFGSIYLMGLDGHDAPRRLTRGATPEFQPSWSPDGRSVTYVTWTARDAGRVWVAPVDGRHAPRALTDSPAFYTYPTYSPDGRSVLTLSSSQWARMHAYMEYGSLRDAELLSIPASGGAASIITRGVMGGRPQWTSEPGRVYLSFTDGLNAVPLDGAPRSRVLTVVGPGWYFAEGPAQADSLRISPDGRYVLAQIAQQLHLVAIPSDAERRVDLSHASAGHRRLTTVGADFFEWADHGRSVTWAVGASFYRRSLAGVTPGLSGTAAGAPAGSAGVEAYSAVVTRPRDVPSGNLVLRGATVITMKGEDVIADADVLVSGDRIAAVGPRGRLAVPPGATIRDVRGKFIVPGFIDAHDHMADVRRGVLDLETWGPLANLAYGVTTGFDPSPLSIDMLAYEDLMDAGLMTGSRIHSTGPALFSFNDFQSPEEVRAVVSRNTTHYRTYNLKEYRTGPRRVREWVAAACLKLGVVPTTEGALSMKLDLTQIEDGFSGHEHALPAVPIYRDVIELLAQTRVSYTPTLQIGNGGPEAQDYYIAKNAPHDDPKLNRFSPHFVVDTKTLHREWHDPREYLFPAVAAGAARVVRAGGLVAVGSHGEMPGLGVHWELQAYVAGGMTSLEALYAATMGSAEATGRHTEFGSIEAGKYADLLVLDKNPLEAIENTLSIREVMKGGRLYDAGSLDELWPRTRRLGPLWFRTDVPPSAAAGRQARTQGHRGATHRSRAVF